jgi:hypothetical protein
MINNAVLQSDGVKFEVGVRAPFVDGTTTYLTVKTDTNELKKLTNNPNPDLQRLADESSKIQTSEAVEVDKTEPDFQLLAQAISLRTDGVVNLFTETFSHDDSRIHKVTINPDLEDGNPEKVDLHVISAGNKSVAFSGRTSPIGQRQVYSLAAISTVRKDQDTLKIESVTAGNAKDSKNTNTYLLVVEFEQK